jgi:hypothetical protein
MKCFNDKTEFRSMKMVLYATESGWIMDEDIVILEHFKRYNKDVSIINKVTDLLAKSVSGSYIRLPHAMIVILANSTN